MEAILKALQDVLVLVQQKDAELAKSLAEARKKNESLENLLHETKALAADLAKRESAVKGIENIIELKQLADATMKEAKERAAALEVHYAGVARTMAEREKKVEEGLALIATKQQGIEEQNKRLKELESNYMERVLKSVQADLDKKGKR